MTIQATPDTIRATTNAIGRAALYDDRITPGDKHRIAAWAEALQPYEFGQTLILEAVTTYYREPRDRAITPGDIITIARENRRRTAETETRQALEARQTRNDHRHGLADPQLGNLPIAGADGPPVPGAYEVDDAIEFDCPTCGAEPMYGCTNRVTGRERKIPCLMRLRVAAKAARVEVRHAA